MNYLDDSSLIFCIIGIPDDLKIQLIRAFTKSRSLTDSDRLKSRVEFIRTQIVIKDTKYDYFDLLLIDIVEYFARLQPGSFRDASGVIITFDKGDRTSFTSVAGLCQRFHIFIPRTPLALVGFITDNEEVVTTEGQSLATRLNASYYDIQPSDKEGIIAIFHDLASKVIFPEK